MKAFVVGAGLVGLTMMVAIPASAAPVVPLSKGVIESVNSNVTDVQWRRCWRDRWGRLVCRHCWRDRWGRVICR